MAINQFNLRLPSFNEWKKAVEVTGGADEKLHWRNMYSWLKDEPQSFTYRGPIRYQIIGHDGAFPDYNTFPQRVHISADVYQRSPEIGFRPVLEPSDPAILSGLKDGDTIRFGTLAMDGELLPLPQLPTSDGDIEGFDDTKLTLENFCQDPEACITWIKAGDILIADRNLLCDISWHDINKQLMALGLNVWLNLPEKGMQHSRAGENAPLWNKLGSNDELDFIFKAAHLAGILETEKQILVHDWDDLTRTVKDSISEYMKRSETDDCDFFETVEEHLKRAFPVKPSLESQLEQASSRIQTHEVPTPSTQFRGRA